MVYAKVDSARIFALIIPAEKLYIRNVNRNNKLGVKIFKLKVLKHKGKILRNGVEAINLNLFALLHKTSCKRRCAAESIAVWMSMAKKQNLI